MRLGKRRSKKDGRFGVGKLDADFLTTTLLSQIKLVATQSMESYAEQEFLYQEEQKTFIRPDTFNESEVEALLTAIPSTLTFSPPRKPLFHSEYQFRIFEATVVQSLQDHFFVEKGGWRIKANAAKFDRLLDERYGVFRPFISKYPEIDQFVRSVQRKYAVGYFSPFRQNSFPVSKGNAVILLFMMYRGKVSWKIMVLVALFLLVGLQPWFLVLTVSFIKVLFIIRKQAALGRMSRSIPASKPYYMVGIDCTSLDDKEMNRHKVELIQKPVGTSIGKLSPSFDITDTSTYDVIMLGSGPGTLYTASLLSRAGRKVLVLCRQEDASGCVTFRGCKDEQATQELGCIPIDVECCNVSKVTRQQQLMAPALCTESDYQGGIRFAQIGSKSDGYAFEILSVPGMGVEALDQANPFVISAFGGLQSLMEQTANYLGDGWPDATGDIGQSLTGAYVKACEAINASSGLFYLSKILPDSVNRLRAESSYYDSAIRDASFFLNKVFPSNVHLRSLMAAIGMKAENIQPSKTSMAAHATNICSSLSGEGMHYPLGGPRALSHALATVVEQSGGRIVTDAAAIELIFDETITTKPSDGETDDGSPPPPCCVGVKLANGTEVRFHKSRYKSSSDSWPLVVSTEGFIQTFIRMLPDAIRTKYKVPQGLPALSESRPIMHAILGLRGSALDLSLTGADFFRLPGASVARDEIDPQTGEVIHGDIGWCDDVKPADEDLQMIHDVEVTGRDQKDDRKESKRRILEPKRKKGGVKFESGVSWMRISFPSAKDPTFESRYGKITICVVSFEADDDFTQSLDTRPNLFVMKPSKTTSGSASRLLDRVKRDLVDIYPQIDGKFKGYNC